MSRMTLRAARVNAGLTQKDAAKKIGVSNKTLCRWENGDTQPKVGEQIDSICSIYGVDYDNIIFLSKESL